MTDRCCRSKDNLYLVPKVSDGDYTYKWFRCKMCKRTLLKDKQSTSDSGRFNREPYDSLCTV